MDDNAPATKGDLKNFATKDDLRKFATKEDLEKFVTKDDLRRVNEGIDQVLTVLINMDKRLGGKIENHERRITKLESSVA